jgi:hypothetical protein
MSDTRFLPKKPVSNSGVVYVPPSSHVARSSDGSGYTVYQPPQAPPLQPVQSPVGHTISAQLPAKPVVRN